MGKYDGGAHLLQAWSVLHQLCHLLLSAFHKGSGVIKDLLLPGKALGVAPQSFCLHTADMMNMALLVHITTVTSVCAQRQQHTPLLPVKAVNLQDKEEVQEYTMFDAKQRQLRHGRVLV